MEILRAFKIAIREWENIRVSLEDFGDIGEFDSKTHISSRLTLSPGGLTMAWKLIEMDNKLTTHGYITQEAASVFTTLASRAAERLELRGVLAQTFGSGYSWVRTGCFEPNVMEKEHIIRQLFFFKIFFPLGGYFNWDFSSPVVKTKLMVLLHKFAKWQDNPTIYLQDVNEYKEQLEPLWNGLSSAMSFTIADSIGKHRIWEEGTGI